MKILECLMSVLFMFGIILIVIAAGCIGYGGSIVLALQLMGAGIVSAATGAVFCHKCQAK